MDDSFYIAPKNEKSVTITVRINMRSNAFLEELALKTGRSRNEIINLALEYAFSHIDSEEMK